LLVEARFLDPRSRARDYIDEARDYIDEARDCFSGASNRPAVSLELIAALAQVFTALVIAATAIAALIQLQHMRGGNQIATMARFETLDLSQAVEDSKKFIVEELEERMKDPAFREALAGASLTGDARQLLPILNFYEQMGNYVRHGYIDKDFTMDSYATPILSVWGRFKSVLPYLRRGQGADIGVSFEYLAALSQQYMDHQRLPSYPGGVPRLPLDTSLFDADMRARRDTAS
jgi:hypothetical protein